MRINVALPCLFMYLVPIYVTLTSLSSPVWMMPLPVPPHTCVFCVSSLFQAGGCWRGSYGNPILYCVGVMPVVISHYR